MKISLEALLAHVSGLILDGATEVRLEFPGGLNVLLGWRFPGEPGDCLLLELEESCLSDSSC